MNIAYLNSSEFSFFTDAREQLEQIITVLQSEEKMCSEHGDIEQYINIQGQDLLRRLLQGYLDLTAKDEPKRLVQTADGQDLNHVKNKTSRNIISLFGKVKVNRKSYSQRDQASQFPLDAQFNLPDDQYSDGIRQRNALEAIKSSFDNAIESIDKTTGGHIPKRQSLQLVQDVAQDFELYYEQNHYQRPEDTDDLLVLTFDGKGIVMRPDGLRECTKKAALKSKKLNSRLSPGEKKDRKRMAQVAAVYTVLPHHRTAEFIMKGHEDEVSKIKPFQVPARNKRVWASVEREVEAVIEEAFQEALHRDPKQQRKWVILIDGHPHQIKLIQRVMKRLKVNATIVMDFIHVLEYLWKAAWCFFDKGDDAVESWIEKRAIKILNGQCSQVAKGIRISASKQKLNKREAVDKCADYLIKNKKRLAYDTALADGLPIASGVIEGACRHLINDRLDITGARWSLAGAEAMLKLRSLKSSGDFDEYWSFHKKQSKLRLYTNFNLMDE